MRRADRFQAKPSRGAGVKTARVKREVCVINRSAAGAGVVYKNRRFTLARALRWCSIWGLRSEKSIAILQLKKVIVHPILVPEKFAFSSLLRRSPYW